jgi:serine-type D-Ala-D-Ala carboxypeptidase (penicillin-binding protein 5/6)
MFKRLSVSAFLLLAVLTAMSGNSFAASEGPTSVFAQPNVQNNSPTLSPAPASAAALNPVPPTLNVSGYYLQDAYSGQVLASMSAEQRMQPASLTKLMTLYITFEALQAGRIHMDDLVSISQNAWGTGGSRMFLKPGDRVSVSALIDGVIIDSGNDACVALAEYVGGTEGSFVGLMNEQAQLLGMKNTHYMDCTGLPDPQHYTTPHDMAILTRAIILNFPQYYPLFSQKTYSYNNITQPNRNRLLWRDPSVDGLKTGHTDEAGFCLIASAQRNGMRLISILIGAPSDALRAEYSEDLLNYGYRFYETHKIYSANVPIEQVPVYYGKVNTVPVGVGSDFYVTVPSGQYQKVKMGLQLNVPLKAPLTQDEKIGTIVATVNGKAVANTDAVALQAIDKGGIFTRMFDHMKLVVSKA